MEQAPNKTSHHIIRTLPHLPAHSLHISLWTGLQNASFLRRQLLEGNREFEYAFLDAEMIISETHLLAACFRALRDADAGRLKSQNLHSEIVFAMGAGNNIGEALRTFGIQTTSTSLAVVKVLLSASSGGPDAASAAVTAHLDRHISASPAAFTDSALAQLRNTARLGRAYKVPASAGPEMAGGRTRAKKIGKNEAGPKAMADARLASGRGGDEDEAEKGTEVDRIARLERVAVAAIALRGAG